MNFNDEGAKKKAKEGFAALVRKAMSASMFGEGGEKEPSDDASSGIPAMDETPQEEAAEPMDEETLEKLRRLLSEG